MKWIVCLSFPIQYFGIRINDGLLFQESTGSNLTYAMSFLPLARSSAMLNFYGNIEGKQLCDGITEIVAMDFGKTFITGIIPFGKYHISWKINFSFCKLRSL